MARIRLDDFRGMELVSDLFIAPASALAEAFPGWLAPLPSPVQRHLHNPFTGEPMFHASGAARLIETREPEGPWPRELSCPRLTRFPRVSLRPVRHADLVVLGRVLPARVHHVAVPALFAPPGHGWFLWQLSDAVSRELANLTVASEIGKAWWTALRSDEDFHPEDYATVDDWGELVASIARAASDAIARNHSLYLYDGPV